MRLRSSLALAVLVAAMAFPGIAPASDHPCTGRELPGGEWRSYGKDLGGTRAQDAPSAITAATVSALEMAWATVPSAVSAGTSTATVAGGCVYVGGGDGRITALDVVTGEVVWRKIAAPPQFSQKRLINAVSVQGTTVYANVSEADGSGGDAAPIGVALDADTGDPIYDTERVTFGQPTTAVASAVAWGDLQLVVTNGGDGVPTARPGYALFDNRTGQTLRMHTTIPAHDLDQGYAGGGMWATPAVDPVAGYAYVGTANPYSKKMEHRYDNAIIKIDVNRESDRFGQIVDAYKGDTDQYFTGLDRQVLCDELGDDIGYHPCCNFSVTCVQLDIDFGASPSLFRNKNGELLVGEMQKSGVFHTVYADTMQRAWTTLLATPPPATAGNASSSATDGRYVFVLANPGILHALDVNTGRIVWSSPVADGAEYTPVSVSNGVVYALGHHGLLMAFDADDGTPLYASSVPLSANAVCVPLGGGITIAAETVIANCDGRLAAFRLP